jgi:hypothetical protein
VSQAEIGNVGDGFDFSFSQQAPINVEHWLCSERRSGSELVVLISMKVAKIACETLCCEIGVAEEEPTLLSERCRRQATGGGNLTVTALPRSLPSPSDDDRLRGGKNRDRSLP